MGAVRICQISSCINVMSINNVCKVVFDDFVVFLADWVFLRFS